MKNFFSALFLTCLLGLGSFAQVKIGLPAGAANSSAILDLSNTGGLVKGGLLLPILTTIQRDAISTPAAGLQIFNADINTMQYWNGVTWISQTASSAASTVTPDCSTMQQSGVYQVGTPTSSSNSISFSVNVSTTGSWSATTNTVNSVSFSGGGVFATPGTQTITLFANPNVTPAANGTFLYTISIGTSTCTFNVIYNSLAPCTTPSAALVTPSVCAIPVGTSKVFTLTSGGTINTTTLTYSVSPATGVSPASGTVTAGATPAITFATAGTYTITFKATNASTASCNVSSITTSTAFSVVTGPTTAAPAAYTNTGRFGPSAFSGGSGSTYVSTVAGVAVTTTWTGQSNTYGYGFCGFAAPPTTIFYSVPGQNNTFTFSQPISNLQLITGYDNADKITITAKNGGTDVSSQLVFTKYGTCAANYVATTCNSFTGPSGGSSAVGFNIGGVYFTSLTVIIESTGNAGTDMQFDLSFGNSTSNGCVLPTPLLITNTSTPSPLPYPIAAGNSINFVATGGTPNTSGVSWILSSTPGSLITSPLTGTGYNATAIMAAGATGAITVVYNVTNSGTGGCLPTPVTATQTVNVMSTPPLVNTALCTSWISPNDLSATLPSTTSKTIGNNTVNITRTGNPNSSNTSYSSTNTSCVVALTSPNFNGGGAAAYTFSFDKDVSNIQILNGMDAVGNTHLYKIYKRGVEITSQIVLTQLGNCLANTTISGNLVTQNVASSQSSAVSIGGVYFDRLDVFGTANADAQFLIGVCNGSSVDPCPTPSSFIISHNYTPTVLSQPVVAGQTVNFTATGGGTPNTSGVSWALTSIPSSGLLTGALTGTGTTATATLAANAKGSVVVTYSTTNTSGSCNPTTTSTSDTAVVSDNIRLALSTSVAAYDAAAVNAWVKITPAEYALIRDPSTGTVTQTTSYYQSEANMNTITTTSEPNGGAYGYTTPILAGSYIYGFSFRTPSSGGLGVFGAGAVNITTGTVLPATSAFTVYPASGSSLPALSPVNDTRYCYVLKLDNARTVTTVYPGITTTIGPIFGSQPGAPLFYYGTVATYPSGGPSTISHDVQFLGTTNKQW